MSSQGARSAVVIPVPAAEPLVSSWRTRFDPSAAEGMPAHITALVPFLTEDRLTENAIARLRDICANLPIPDIEFRRTARFPAVIYLDPEPAEPLRHLTTKIANEWPEAPPYGGQFESVVPHLTVADGVDDETMTAIENELQPGLPLRTQLTEARLYVFKEQRWQSRERLPFRANAS